MAVVQLNKQKVRPVMDFREMNTHVDTFTADADVCNEKLREWRKLGRDVALLDLNKAYLQIHVEKEMWPYQTVIVGGVRYCLTRMGFGLSVSPCVMKSVLDLVVSQDSDVQRAVSTYIDDVLVDEAVLPAEKVAEHLKRFGLECKPAVKLKDGGRALGLRVSAGTDGLRWRQDNEVTGIELPLTKRKIFSFCGRLTGNLPVCGWLRPATSYLKRRASALSERWDDPIEDSEVKIMVQDLLEKVAADDPAKGRWDVSGRDVTVWTDASSLALGVALEADGELIEDGCWLRKDDGTHINVAELDAAIKGVNLAISWGAKKVVLMTDSRTVYHWISNSLSGKMRLKTKAASEMLIRRRLSTLQMLGEEYRLDMSVRSVTSAANRSDNLTRVPRKWLSPEVKTKAPGTPRGATETRDPEAGNDKHRALCAAIGTTARSDSCQIAEAAVQREEDGISANELGVTGVAAVATAVQCEQDRVAQIHADAGHPGIRRTHFFAKRVMPTVTKTCVRNVVTSCQVCQSIDPAPVKWKKGELSVKQVWTRLGIDVTEYRGRLYLTIIDCGPSRFTIWRPLRLKTSSVLVAELRSILLERGAPDEILLDNDPVFRSRRFGAFAAEWGVRLTFRCAYVPSGNGVTERVHRTVKTIAARKGCDISEAVYIYNMTPKDNKTDNSTPANQLYRYNWRTSLPHSDPSAQQEPAGGYRPPKEAYEPGDAVWVRPPGARCHTQYEQGVVTRTLSEQAVEVNGVPRHVRELRHRLQQDHEAEDDSDSSEKGPMLVSLPVRQPEVTPQSETAPVTGRDRPETVLRRSERLRSRAARESQV
ncbi:uncharacterized protein LOC122389602 [Amphibalanus amphitrite]|uniref:uncharacterized protein LOC122389602 n=1 Tax=Amphibalanus amphitrite TaxID=1232801 RepID=UPI001C91C139|nr:uncharacterized protein LOC122389602 [Amphibalanus amphitrite]